MTYNIQGREASGWTLGDPKVQALVRQLQRYRPDVVGFQEVPDDFASAPRANGKTVLQQVVDQAFPGEGYHVAVGPLRFGERSVVISRWPISESQSFLGDAPLAAFGDSHTFRKDLFHARIGNFHFFTAHLKAYLQKPANIPWRLAEARAIQHFLVNQFPTFRRGPYVLVGDMNEDINNPKPGHNIGAIHALLAGTGLNLITPVREGSNDNDTWWDGKDPDPRKRFDYILPEALLLNTINGRMKVGGRWQDAQDVSDHYPVMATFTIDSSVLMPPPGSDPREDPAPNPVNHAVPGYDVATGALIAPDTVVAGEPFQATLTMYNVGSKRWEGGPTPHGLGTPNEMNGDFRWVTQRVPLLNPVPPGSYYTFVIQATAPLATGPQEFKWQMVEDGVEWFGQAASKLIHVVPPSNNASVVSVSVPGSVIAGQTFPVEVTLRNTGSTIWRADGTPHALGSQSPENNGHWGTARVPLPSEVRPNEQTTFRWTARAPSSPGSHMFHWRMVEDGVEWFGGAVQVPVAVVAGNDASVLSHNVPDTVTAGQRFTASITLRNTGGKAWEADATPHRLGSQSPQDNGVWGLGRVDLRSTVPPNGDATFDIMSTAPQTPGTYTFAWRMVEDGVEWFGQTFTKTIRVLPEDKNTWVGVEVPRPIATQRKFSVTVRFTNSGGLTWTPSTHALQIHNGSLWGGINRVTLPRTTAPGETATFQFDASAPATPGRHPLDVQMVATGTDRPGGLGWRVSTPIEVVTDSGEWVGLSVPRPVATTKRFPVLVRFKNTGGVTWTAATHALRVHNGNLWGGMSRVALSRATAPGETAIFEFDAIAPTTPGFHQIDVQMEVSSHGGWAGFGPRTGTPIEVVSEGKPNDAVVEGVSLSPGEVKIGSRFYALITMKNTGTRAWDSDSTPHRLASVGSSGTWGLTRVDLPSGVTVAPGQTVRFMVWATAPKTPGEFDFHWSMVEEGGESFGQPVRMRLRVAQSHGSDNALAGIEYPQAVPKGQRFPVTVRFVNTGTVTWTPATHRLVLNNADLWGGVSPVPVSQNVAPGETATFRFEAMAPATAGAEWHPMALQMRQWQAPYWNGMGSTMGINIRMQ